MTIHDLRKIIYVKVFINNKMGANVTYYINNERKNQEWTFDSLCSELISISSIDDKQELLDGYNISQWDALNLVVRHEYYKHIESDIKASDIFEAIANIIKPK